MKQRNSFNKNKKKFNNKKNIKRIFFIFNKNNLGAQLCFQESDRTGTAYAEGGKEARRAEDKCAPTGSQNDKIQTTLGSPEKFD